MTKNDCSSGMVQWPTPNDSRYRSSGEGGLVAYAVWDVLSYEQNRALVCRTNLRMSLRIDGVLAGSSGLGAGRFDNRQYNEELDAVVLLGSTSATPWDEEAGHYFTVTEKDLTEEGQQVLKTLSAVYGAAPVILTILDT